MKLPTQEETDNFETALKVLREQNEERNRAFNKAREIEESYNKALFNIKQNGKKLFILFHLDGCYGCTVMNYIVQYNEAIVQELENNYEVLIAEMSGVQSHLVDKYNLYSFPTYIVIDNNEHILKQNYGCYIQGAGVEYNFLQWLKND